MKLRHLQAKFEDLQVLKTVKNNIETEQSDLEKERSDLSDLSEEEEPRFDSSFKRRSVIRFESVKRKKYNKQMTK